MKSKVLFFVWHFTFHLATPNGEQIVHAYKTADVDSVTPTNVWPVGGDEGMRYEAGYCGGVMRRIIGVEVDAKKSGWNMVLSKGTFEGLEPRTYTEILNGELTKNYVELESLGFISKEFFGFIMPYKIYQDPYDVPGAPPRPVKPKEKCDPYLTCGFHD